MATIGPKNVNRNTTPNQNLDLQRRRALEADVSKAKTTNAATLGRQNSRTTEDKKATETPRERVTLTSAEPGAEKLAEAETPSAPKAATAEAAATQGKSQAAPQEKGAEEYKMDFVNTFVDTLSREESEKIGTAAAQSMVEMAGSDGNVQHEKVLAAHTYNHAKRIISEKMPNASQKEIREAAKSDPELAKAVKLIDASSAYLKAAQKEEAVGATTGEGVPSDGAPSTGSPANDAAPTPGASAGADPFAAHRAASGDQQLGESGEPGQPQPPDSEQPQSPYHLSPEKQAQMMAENHQTMMEISKIYQQMYADMRKAAAERHQLMQETAIAIFDIYRSLHVSRARSHAKHFQSYMQILTDAWG